MGELPIDLGGDRLVHLLVGTRHGVQERTHL